MKICSEPNCSNPPWGGSKCRYHQYKRHMQGGDKFSPKRKKKALETQSSLFDTKMPQESKKRKKEHRRYSEQIIEFWDESVENKTDFCFFCGVHMDRRDNIHHLRGRTGEYYLDKEYWVNAHNDCHVYKYHMMNTEQLELSPWYPEFMERLKSKDYASYCKELKKQDKKANIDLE
jgi:hypothetical protein